MIRGGEHLNFKRDHVFQRVTPMTGVGRAVKSNKLTPRFIGPFQITERVGEVLYRIALPPTLANLHDVFHVAQLRKYIADPSRVTQVDDIQVKDNLTVEALPMRIEDRKLKQLRGNEIAFFRMCYGTHMLSEEADDWWMSTRAELDADGIEITWAIFKR
ncbi:uncharacterized protein LOC131650768 [Vicia villosa]|uniref:uncharacterized protein LOC131650768 n=1 Tax=Vicia villosa TaxID=3911 RepID=UPI00273ABB3E|nr:uncharacterized protein LOC131650768 [Vicia villosa]